MERTKGGKHSLKLSKAKRIHHHETSFTTKVRGNSLEKKTKGPNQKQEKYGRRMCWQKQTYHKGRKSSTQSQEGC